MTTLWLDFETRSACDLKARGVYNYVMDPSTEVLCMAWAFDDEEVTVSTDVPERVRQHRGQIRAHNAAFERLVCEYVLELPFKLEQFYCTAAQSRANCAPGSLEDVGRFAGVTMRKDHRGAKLVRECCIPPYNTELLPELFDYCAQDVRTMRAISQAQRELTADELEDYHVNERINDRGVLLDVDLCRAAVRYAAAETEDIQRLVADITGGAVRSVRSPSLRAWVHDRLGEQARKLTVGSNGRPSIDKVVRANLLLMDDPDEVPPEVADVIQCADDLWASSVAKFQRAADLADDEDHRVRGAFMFAGGSATGRASSLGLQAHNFPRKSARDPEAVRHAMVRGHAIVPTYGARVTDVLKQMLRPALLAPPGQVLTIADWAAIEARVNPWLSGAGDDKLALFAAGEDVYVANARATFTGEITPDRRQVGKVQELACGFGGGVGAFAAMGRAYGVLLPEHEAKRMVYAWRRANPWAVGFWADLERAYMRAMRNPGHQTRAGRIAYLFDGVHLWYALPSGRVLCYPYARLEDGGVTYAKAAWKPAQGAEEWPRARLWMGLACENVTQATANDLLRHALRRCEAEGLKVVLHVHDEIVVEGECDLLPIMTTPPAWAEGLPLAAEVKTVGRYGK